MRTLIVFALTALLVACSGEGEGTANSGAEPGETAYDGTAAQLIQRGMTQDEVRNRLGEPLTRVATDAGVERWTYYAHDPQGQMVARTIIVFGEDKAVADVTHGQR